MDPRSTWDPGPGPPALAPAGSSLATRRPATRPPSCEVGPLPRGSPRSPQPRWVYVCLFICFRLNSDLFHVWFGNVQTQKSKKIREDWGPCPNPLRLGGGSTWIPCPPAPPARSHSPPVEVQPGCVPEEGSGVRAGAGARPLGAGLPRMCSEPWGMHASDAVGGWVDGGHRPELGRFAGARVLECMAGGVAGAWKCWFEAGKLTVKFNCCLRGGAQAVRSARVQTSRGCLPLESQAAPRPGQRHTPPPGLSGPAASPPQSRPPVRQVWLNPPDPQSRAALVWVPAGASLGGRGGA